MNLRIAACFVVALLCLNSMMQAAAQGGLRAFTVADAIKTAILDPLDIRFSPDGKYIAVYYERGRLSMNRLEDSLRFYRTQDIERFLHHPELKREPAPVWTFSRIAKEGPVIQGWQWLADSSGVAFVAPANNGNEQLALATFGSKTVEPLTTQEQSVVLYYVRGRSHYIYTVQDLSELKKRKSEEQEPAIVGTGRSFMDLFSLGTQTPYQPLFWSRSQLWAADGGKPFRVPHGSQFAALPQGDATLTLSHDGRWMVTSLLVPHVPPSWKMLYPSSDVSYRRISGDHMLQYVLVDLKSGMVRSLTKAPLSNWWFQEGNPRWSDDDRRVYLPNTFVESQNNNVAANPCPMAVVTLITGNTVCTRSSERELPINCGRYGHICTSSEIGGSLENRRGDLEVTVEQGLNEPPLLVANMGRASRVLWNPNPQLQKVQLGQASVYTWTDAKGRIWRGGLYRPADYQSGTRYPLVIQTHGFSESEFSSTGFDGTGYAARALTASSIIVLQVGEEQHCSWGDRIDVYGQCDITAYASAVRQLASEGMVDPDKVGIMGFSATVTSVLEVLTASSMHVSAAILNDNHDLGYLNYLVGDPEVDNDLDITMGAQPFGEGLQQWLKQAPTFNLGKAHAPVSVVAISDPSRLLWLWETYAVLRDLHKPVDLIILNSLGHPMTNPAVRFVAEGNAVDWFRFWLQGYEDPDPAKRTQYKRWEGLRKLQQTNEANGRTAATQ